MARPITLLAVVLLALATPALAQTAQPYAGLETREIKALAPERVAGLLAGQGLGYALSAELNGFPGPMHALELAERLELTPAQRARLEAVMAAMRAEARALGARLVEAETHLERMFRMGHIDADSLRARTAAIGAIDADLRRVHLAAHLETHAALTPAQVALYNTLRGYGAAGGPAPGGHGHHGHGHAPHRAP